MHGRWQSKASGASTDVSRRNCGNGLAVIRAGYVSRHRHRQNLTWPKPSITHHLHQSTRSLPTSAAIPRSGPPLSPDPVSFSLSLPFILIIHIHNIYFHHEQDCSFIPSVCLGHCRLRPLHLLWSPFLNKPQHGRHHCSDQGAT